MTEDQLRAELAAVYASTSWRITAPLRFIGALTKRSRLPGVHPRRFVREFLRGTMRNIVIRKLGIKLLTPFPFLRERIRRIALTYVQGAMPSNMSSYSVPKLEVGLSQPAREVLAELREAKRNVHFNRTS